MTRPAPCVRSKTIILLKRMLPNRDVPLPILLGPFRGARIHMHPRHSLRKMLGVYEHELNPWLKTVLPQVNTVLDIGANDGYFTFGCAAAFERRKQTATILAFEPQAQHIQQLTATLKEHPYSSVNVSIRQSMVGNCSGPDVTTLNEISQTGCGSALVKIDVEGAELEVVQGASFWLKPTNFFLIEVHREEYITQLQEHFASVGIILKKVRQKPLPFLGKETRDDANWWLVSEVGLRTTQNHETVDRVRPRA